MLMVGIVDKRWWWRLRAKNVKRVKERDKESWQWGLRAKSRERERERERDLVFNKYKISLKKL